MSSLITYGIITIIVMVIIGLIVYLYNSRIKQPTVNIITDEPSYINLSAGLDQPASTNTARIRQFIDSVELYISSIDFRKGNEEKETIIYEPPNQITINLSKRAEDDDLPTLSSSTSSSTSISTSTVKPGTYTSMVLQVSKIVALKNQIIVSEFNPVNPPTIPIIIRNTIVVSGGENAIQLIFDGKSMITINPATGKFKFSLKPKRIRKKSRYEVSGEEKEVEEDSDLEDEKTDTIDVEEDSDNDD